MKQIISILTVLMMSVSALAGRGLELKNWRYASEQGGEWRACKVPSVVQECLIKDELIPDPHFRTNEKLIQWVGESDWLYEADFDYKEARLPDAEDFYILELEGIDTYSSVYVNGQLVGKTENMFRAYRFDIGRYLRRGRNVLRIHLHSPIEMAKPLQAKAGFNYPADNDHAEIRYSPFTRKAPYHYGWDWGMRMLTMGIWQPLRISHYRRAVFERLDVHTEVFWQGDKYDYAEVKYKPYLSAYPEGMSARVELFNPRGQLVATRSMVLDGKEQVLRLDNAELWWPRGWGEPKLYKLRYTIPELAVVEERELGFRSVKLVHKPNQPVGQSSFYFEVNKRPFYARGANYIPGENMLTKRTDEDFVRLFRDATFANMNMLRVWGGGVYEDERFYREADRQGVLLWQDFMFACTAYPADSAFLENVRAEAEYQVQRLRHHPSIVLWCGNNEVEEAIKYWGWQKRFEAKHYERMQADYDPIFRQLLPEVVQTYAPELTYIHSSPTSANWGRPATWLEGDSHYWGLWYGEEPFDTFEEKRFAFVSEFGFQSFPDVPSLMAFALPDEDFSLDSEVMRQHQKASTGNELIRKYMERDYVVPKDFEDFVFVGLVMQARGMEQAVRAMRRHRPTTMGALVWQLNDSWPAVSWSSIDYYQNYKALHYRLRDAFAPITILPYRDAETNELNISVANDNLQSYEGLSLSVTTKTFAGEVLGRRDVSRVTLLANQVNKVLSCSLESIVGRLDAYVVVELKRGAEIVAHYKYYPMKPKEMRLPKADFDYRLERGSRPNEYIIHVKANAFVKDFWVSSSVMGLRYSENLLDLEAGEERAIRVVLPEGKRLDLSERAFFLRALNGWPVAQV